MIFVQNQVPAVAVTWERAMQNLATITHTPEDKPELVEAEKLADLAAALRALLLVLEKTTSSGHGDSAPRRHQLQGAGP